MKRYQSITSKLPAAIAIGALLIVWHFACALELVPSFMLPSPGDVLKALISEFPLLMMHAKVTLLEAAYGLGAGILVAFVFATLMDRFAFLYRAFYPTIVVTQTIPTIAIAPLLVLWMGFEMAPETRTAVIPAARRRMPEMMLSCRISVSVVVPTGSISAFSRIKYFLPPFSVIVEVMMLSGTSLLASTAAPVRKFPRMRSV